MTRPVLAPLPAMKGAASDRLVLRDGTVATVRAATPADREALRRFFRDLSAESRRNRFLGGGDAPESIVDRLADSSDPSQALTLIAVRELPTGVRPIAVASYARVHDDAAETAFAVDDQFHGKGIATALLERLAAVASEHGFRWFEATTFGDNHAMLEVFRDSGFRVRSMPQQGVIDVRLDLTPSVDAVAAIDERNRVATVRSLVPILQPRSVVVAGVSRSHSNLGRRIFDALIGGEFQGPLYAVNPHATEISGRPCFASVRDVPRGVDLAVIAVPRDAVLPVVDECAAAGVRSLVVVSAGFAETGEEGRRLQRTLADKARGFGMRLIGPNCMGVINARPEVRLNASFAEALPPYGRIALSSQSGGLGLTILQLAAARQIGISTFVSLGNKADVSGNDLIQYGESDPDTSVILLYLESFGNPRRFAQLARRIARKKPIVVIKAGRTRAGTRAASSHTAGLASSDAAAAALFQQSGVIRADTIDEMFDIAACLDLQPLPPGRRVAIITNAGGPGILAADACEAAGLTVAEFSGATQRRLGEHVSANASTVNPVDLVASAGAEAYRHAIEAVLADGDIDALLVIYTPVERQHAHAILAAVGESVAAARRSGVTAKPVLACVMTPGGQPTPLPAGPEAIPAYMFPENAARALARAAAYAEWRARPTGLFWVFDDVREQEARALCREIVATRGETWLTPEELERVLDAFGLPLVAGPMAHTEDEAVAHAATVGYPVVLKVSASGIVHKTDVGGVRVNLADAAAVRAAFADIASRIEAVRRPGSGAAIVVQPMVTGIETLVGLSEDPVFGPLVAFGLGGVNVELLKDVAFRVAPLTDRDADDLLHAVRSFPLLNGYRGRPPADLDALREVLLRVSLIGQHIPEVLELDLNPLIVLPRQQGCRIVDARLKVGAPRG